MKSFVSWRPLAASELAQVGAAIDKAVARWSAAWLPAERALASGPAEMRAPAASARQIWNYGDRVWLVADPAVIDNLVLAALGASGARWPEDAHFDRVLSGLRQPLLHALATQIDGAFVATDPAPAAFAACEAVRADHVDKGVCIELKANARTAIEVFLPHAVFAERLPRAPAPPRGGLAPRAAAIGAVQVQLRASAGTVDLTAEQLVGLRTDDVLVLPATLSDPVAVFVEGADTASLEAYLCQRNRRLALEVSAMVG